jgi:hypothetical protein
MGLPFYTDIYKALKVNQISPFSSIPVLGIKLIGSVLCLLEIYERCLVLLVNNNATLEKPAITPYQAPSAGRY